MRSWGSPGSFENRNVAGGTVASKQPDQVVALYEAVSARLESAGFKLDKKPYRSHVTIGRVKRGKSESLGSYLEEVSDSWGTTRVRNMYCYRSDLKPTGAEYFVMWRQPLLGRSQQPKRDEDRDETLPSESAGDEENHDR